MHLPGQLAESVAVARVSRRAARERATRGLKRELGQSGKGRPPLGRGRRRRGCSSVIKCNGKGVKIHDELKQVRREYTLDKHNVSDYTRIQFSLCLSYNVLSYRNCFICQANQDHHLVIYLYSPTNFALGD